MGKLSLCWIFVQLKSNTSQRLTTRETSVAEIKHIVIEDDTKSKDDWY